MAEISGMWSKRESSRRGHAGSRTGNSPCDLRSPEVVASMPISDRPFTTPSAGWIGCLAMRSNQQRSQHAFFRNMVMSTTKS